MPQFLASKVVKSAVSSCGVYLGKSWLVVMSLVSTKLEGEGYSELEFYLA